MKKQLVLGLLGACVLSGNAQTFKEWQDPEINAINRAPMHANFFAYENAEMAVSMSLTASSMSPFSSLMKR